MVQLVKIEGLRETEAALAALGKSLGKGVLRRTAKKALTPFDATWRKLAPDNPATGEDDLKTSGGISTRLTKRQAKEHRRAFRNDRSSIEMFAGPENSAAVPMEFGTAERFKRSGVSTGAVDPRPFVRPAWDATRLAMPTMISRDLWTEIQATAARKARRDAKKAAKR